MKRVEKVAKYLIDNGLQSEQIVLKSVGSEYPIAQTVLNGVANAAGEKLNRRIDLAVRDLATPPLPLKVTYNEPTVSQFMVNETGDRLKKHAVGLSYKIQIVTTKRIYDNEILSKYGDAMMETVGTDGTYAYSVGLFFDYNSAEKTRRDLVKDNMREAAVVPYVDGQRVAGDEARRFTTLYADLVNYLAARKRP